MASVELRNVAKSFGRVEAVRDVSLTVADQELVVFVGPSGCGKSTLLRMIAGLEEISSGELLIGGRVMNRIAAVDRGIAMVFQSYALYPHMSVAENMRFALKMIGTDRNEIDRKVNEAAAILRLDDLLDRKPRQLSGGQRQRVAIGRAIVRQPDVFLFDEPLSNLDADLRAEMRVEIARLHKQLASTMIYVTHDQVEAMTLADRIVILNQGRVEQVGTPLELYERPANRFVAGFLGQPKMNFLPAVAAPASEGRLGLQLASSGARIGTVPQSGGIVAGDVVDVGIRPHAIELSETGGLAATVVLVERLGGTSLVHARVDGLPTLLTVELAGSYAAAPDTPLHLKLNPERVHIFDGSGAALT